MKKKYLVLLLIFAVCCTKNDSKQFQITGNIDGEGISKIYLKYGSTIDSASVIGNTFFFQGKIDSPTEAALFPLHPSSKAPMTLGVFMLENSKISIFTKYKRKKSNGIWTDFLQLDSVKGSKTQNLKTSFENKMDHTFYKAEEDSIKAKMLYENLNEFISAHPKSVLSGAFLYDLGTYFDLLSTEELGKLYLQLDKAYQKPEYLKGIETFINQKKLLAIGKKPPELILPDRKGELISYQKIEADYLLLDFWASWCAPCRQQNPALREMYKKFNDKGFKILGISLDHDRKKWKKAIEEDAIYWVHSIDTARISLDRFKINGIPFNLLLDHEGKIIENDINLKELSQFLVENLK